MGCCANSQSASSTAEKAIGAEIVEAVVTTEQHNTEIQDSVNVSNDPKKKSEVDHIIQDKPNEIFTINESDDDDDGKSNKHELHETSDVSISSLMHSTALKKALNNHDDQSGMQLQASKKQRRHILSKGSNEVEFDEEQMNLVSGDNTAATPGSGTPYVDMFDLRIL